MLYLLDPVAGNIRCGDGPDGPSMVQDLVMDDTFYILLGTSMDEVLVLALAFPFVLTIVLC